MSNDTSSAGQAAGRVSIPSRMRAITFDDYGDPSVLHLSEVDVPATANDGLLIRVAATSVNPIDYRLRSGEMKGLLPGGFPRIPGFDVAGTVVRCPSDGDFRVGDRVMAFLDHLRGGACAEYASCSASVAAVLPASMSFVEAAALPLAGSTALQSLRDHGQLQAGERLLVNGASGGVGSLAIQIAKALGAQVDAVASGVNRDFCLSLGASRFFDYQQTDFTSLDEQWDVIFDAAGKSNYMDARAVLAKGGRYVTTEPDARGMLTTLLTWPLSKSGTAMLAKARGDDLRELIRLYELHQLEVTIDRRFAFTEAAEAHRYLESVADHGKVVIEILPETV